MNLYNIEQLALYNIIKFLDFYSLLNLYDSNKKIRFNIKSIFDNKNYMEQLIIKIYIETILNLINSLYIDISVLLPYYDLNKYNYKDYNYNINIILNNIINEYINNLNNEELNMIKYIYGLNDSTKDDIINYFIKNEINMNNFIENDFLFELFNTKLYYDLLINKLYNNHENYLNYIKKNIQLNDVIDLYKGLDRYIIKEILMDNETNIHNKSLKNKLKILYNKFKIK